MYIAKKEFKSYQKGVIKKGDKCEFKQVWLDAGLIEEKPHKAEVETKPQPKKKKATK